MPLVSLPEFVDRAQGGDVVVFAGASWLSRLIEVLSWGRYSHTAMVVVEPRSGDKYLWQASPVPMQSDPLAPGGEAHAGAQLGPLEAAMIQLDEEADTPTWRPIELDRPVGFDEQLWKVVAGLDRTPFPALGVLAMNYVNGLEGLPPADASMFCSQLVTSTLQQVHLADPVRLANSVAPSDFSSEPRTSPVRLVAGRFLPDQPIAVGP